MLGPQTTHDQQPASSVVGWGPDEQNTVAALSKYGLGLNAANWAVNMGTLSNFEVGNGLKQKGEAAVTCSARTLY